MKDFYNYVNKKWLNETTMEDDVYKISTFDIVTNNNNDKINEIIMNKNNDKNNDKNINKIKKFYDSFINKTLSNNKFNEILDIVDIITNLKQFTYILSFFHLINCNMLWYIYVDEDMYNSKQKILYISQSKLSLYDKSLYEKKEILIHYKKYIYDMFFFVYKNDKLIKNYPDIIINFEKKLSLIMSDMDNLRDIQNYKKITLKELNEEYMKDINFNLYMKMIIKLINNKLNNNKLNINNFENVIIEDDITNNYFIKINNLLMETDIDILKIYLKWIYINNYLPQINNDANDMYFNLYFKILKGQKKQKPLNYLSLNKCKLYFGDLIGNYFGQKYFNPSIHNYINEMIDNIIKSCYLKFKNITWMKDITKQNAVKKLMKINKQIGHNLYIKNYDDLLINDDLLMNLINLEFFLTKDNLNNIINNNDDEWMMNAFEANASYNSSKNRITIPCGILQEEIIKYEIIDGKYYFDDYYNYGTIGTIIGHEIIHAFDDQGRFFDENGNYNNWWSEQDTNEYNIIINKLIKMYDKENINGKLTIGENIADIGGVSIALNALYMRNNNKLSKKQLTDFFRSYANLWKSKITDEYINIAKLTDYHSLPWVRVNTTLKNIDEFYEIYDIENGYKQKDRINLFN